MPTVPPTQTPVPTLEPDLVDGATPVPTRGPIKPGEPLPYAVQTGDTVAAIAAHFNTSIDEVLRANPSLPVSATLPVGLTMTVPAYYFPLGGPAYKIIPDAELVYGPTTTDLDLAGYLQAQPGFLKGLSGYVADRHRSSAETILYVARNYSINPRLLVALMEWRTGAVTAPPGTVPPEVQADPFGPIQGASGFYAQLRWAAEQLSIGYYGWRTGELTSLVLSDSYRSRVDMYQNAGTVGVQYLLAQMVPHDAFDAAAGPQGLGAVYRALWGDPFAGDVAEVIPGGLVQPELALPFLPTQSWSLTGGPHPGWGRYLPWSALDFAPPAGETGCINTDKMVTAAAPGLVLRSGDNMLVLDLDGDGHEGTGWVLFHFHMAGHDLALPGTQVQTGDPLGHPSCEGGTATGTHVHLARKYNGEWIPADGILPGIAPFVLGGWTPVRGQVPYQGRMTRIGAWVEACTCSTAANRVYWVP